MNITKPMAFTAEYGGITRTIETAGQVCKAYDPEKTNREHPTLKQFNALWDTGATSSVITKRVVEELNLLPTGVERVFMQTDTQMAFRFIVSI
jgi:hypothetical protein